MDKEVIKDFKYYSDLCWLIFEGWNTLPKRILKDMVKTLDDFEFGIFKLSLKDRSIKPVYKELIRTRAWMNDWIHAADNNNHKGGEGNWRLRLAATRHAT